ncbi:MAG: hypothetical protein ACJ74Y_15885 [Bryobacteraceae bacterium]
MALEEYRTLLEGFDGSYAPWEATVAGQIDAFVPRFTTERRKTPMLERDLQFLNSDVAGIPRYVFRAMAQRSDSVVERSAGCWLCILHPKQIR